MKVDAFPMEVRNYGYSVMTSGARATQKAPIEKRCHNFGNAYSDWQIVDMKVNNFYHVLIARTSSFSWIK